MTGRLGGALFIGHRVHRCSNQVDSSQEWISTPVDCLFDVSEFLYNELLFQFGLLDYQSFFFTR